MYSKQKQRTFNEEYEFLMNTLCKKIAKTRNNISIFFREQDPNNFKILGIHHEDIQKNDTESFNYLINTLYEKLQIIISEAKEISNIANSHHLTTEELLKTNAFKTYIKQRDAIINLTSHEDVSEVMSIMGNLSYINGKINNSCNNKRLVK